MAEACRCEKNHSKEHNVYRRGPLVLNSATVVFALLAASLWGCDAGRILINNCRLDGAVACPSGHICQALAEEASLPGIGICVPEEEGGGLVGLCKPGNDATCPEGHKCLDTADTPPGAGTCVPNDSCVLGDNAACPSGQKCLDTAHTPPGIGTCMPNDSCLLGNDATCPQGQKCMDTAHTPPGVGTCVPNDSCVLGNDATCPQGQKCMDTAHTPPGIGTCVPDDSCVLGNDATCPQGQKCMDSAYTPPGIGTCVPDSCIPGSVGVCPTHWECREPGICVPENCTPGKDEECPGPLVCVDPWNIQQGTCVPPSCTPGNNGPCPFGWVCTAAGKCEPNIGIVGSSFNIGVVGTTLPLAWTKGHLVIGSSNGPTSYIYFYSPANQTLPPSINVNALTGLSTLGNSGRVAFTTLERVSVVDTSGNYVSPNRTTDCVAGQAPLAKNLRFEHALTLLSVGDDNNGTGRWRFAVPATDDDGYDSNGHRLLAYIPYGSEGHGSGHCIQSEGFQWGPAAPLVRILATNAEIVLIRKTHTSHMAATRGWDNTASTWTTWSPYHLDAVFDRVIGIAADVDNLWASVQTNGSSRLERGPRLAGTGGFVPSVDFASPPALDAKGNAYVVVHALPPVDKYELRVYAPDMVRDSAPIRKGLLGDGMLPAGVQTVGSPILGEPMRSDRPAEVYVVTTHGVVHAFRADDLQRLWTLPLLDNVGQPLGIASTAQPVLKGNYLWIISTRGELRSVRVASEGLNRSARWPRMHRDNCNSNSYLSNSLSCF